MCLLDEERTVLIPGSGVVKGGSDAILNSTAAKPLRLVLVGWLMKIDLISSTISYVGL